MYIKSATEILFLCPRFNGEQNKAIVSKTFILNSGFDNWAFS